MGNQRASSSRLGDPSIRLMTSWRLTRWLLIYLAMLLADAAVVVTVGATV